MKRDELLGWLREADPARLEELFRRADAVRRERVGDGVHLRGLVEVSNHCRRGCAYCGVRAANRDLARYRMDADEVLVAARRARDLGCGTAVLQAGEDPGLSAAWVAGVMRRIKAETGLAVTLSLGEREDRELRLWREAGADRYLLRFETSNRRLYDRIHPPIPGRRSDRLSLLRRLRAMGYETGSGVMVGIPGQTFEDLADDLEWFRHLDLDMIGIGPFVPHPATPLGCPALAASGPEQVPATATAACVVVALARLVCPLANIPATTALDAIAGRRGWELGLVRGANVVMPNLTPLSYRALYEIYPGKEALRDTEAGGGPGARERVLALGRTVAAGPGASGARAARRAAAGPDERAARGDACLHCH
ncbi:MAG: [FeFe] hydrogenase H-cluster radical SAM maturase HydE [Solirubrobacteraceae bacterium]|nr:[FeFe] hydrogenase H-cluster radical SAM maturase HydE [Solirubrobacteraceae bacterium]